MWEGKSDAWIPILIGMCVFFFVVFAWWRAQKDTDLENSNPTTVLDGSGNQITTDTRALMSPDGIQHMERIISALAHRAPLPEPDGLIDHEGNPIPNTKEDARLRVDAANHEAQTATNNAAGALGFYQEREYGIQPIIDEPYSEDVIKTNVKKPDG
ncbi:hypothetical protein GN155_007585 [Alcanivorax sp. ZXX171]|nr:hypothetical protein [Alcanivorax sp. ZXX171]